MIDAVSKRFANRAVIGYLRIFLFYHISIHFFLKNKLTLFLWSDTVKSEFDDSRKRIDSKAEVSVSTDNVDTGKVTGISIFKHGILS